MLQLSCTQKPASHDRQNGSKRCHGKGDFGMKVAMIGHKDFPSRSGGVEVMVGGLGSVARPMEVGEHALEAEFAAAGVQQFGM